MQTTARSPPVVQKEANVCGLFTHDHRFGIRKWTSVDIEDEIAGGQSRQRPEHAPLKLIVRCAFADRFANRKRKQLAHAQRRCKRKCHRAARGDGMEIERHANAYHASSFCAVSRSRLPKESNFAIE
jgi:hypothetical protein